MYAEHSTSLPHVLAWSSTIVAGGRESRVLPDGCLDIIVTDGRVFVAGPDTTAKVGTVEGGTRFAALRFGAGTGPAVLGVPAHELTDRQVPLAALWPGAEVRRIAEAADPLAALHRAARRRGRPPERTLVALAAQARAGTPVAAIADGCSLSARHLHRVCQAGFGYGPKTLARILRLQRALAMARRGHSLADVAAAVGYADQAHLSRDVRDLTGVPPRHLLCPPSPGAG